MGFDRNGIKFLLYAKKIGVDFGKTITIGRQGLHVNEKTFKKNLSEFGFENANVEDILKQESGYSEPFLKLLGATEVHSIDVSDYESATIIHDMNFPIKDTYKACYDVVIDGGTLEHIFNFPTALKNCMSMVKVGGYFIGLTPANNFLGHGFYQFSPELYSKAFSIKNGYQIEKLLFFTYKEDAKWYEVKDTDQIKARATLNNSEPSYLFVLAKRISQEPIFAEIPRQSFYENLLWKNQGENDGIKSVQQKTSIINKLFNLILRKISRFLIKLNVTFKDIGDGNPDFFKEVKK